MRRLVVLISAFAAGCTSTRHERITAPEPVAAVRSATPTVSRSVIGHSVHGRPIDAVTFAFPQLAPADTVLIFAGIHGDEPSSAVVASLLVELLSDPSLDTSAFPQTVVVVPRASPDGVIAKTRVNANRVDLNRNFPASNWKESRRDRNWNGPSPLSEPESRAIHDLVVSLKPARIVSIHSIRPPRHGNNYDGPAEPLARLMAQHNGYAVLPTMGYPTPGSFGSWAGIDRQIPVITLELPSNVPGDKVWPVNRDALLAFIRGK